MRSIKTKLILAFSSVILMVTIAIGAVAILNGYHSLREEAQKSLELLAVEGAKVTESRMETLVSTLELISKKKEIIAMGWEADLTTMAEELKKTEFLDIGYVLPNGYTYYTDGTVRLMSDRSYVEGALQGASSISDVIISRVTRKPEIEVSVPIFTEGEVVGALVARMEADSLGHIIKDSGFGENGYAYMINGEGTIIAHKDTDKVISRHNPIKEVSKAPELSSVAVAFEAILKNKLGYTEYVINEKGYYAGFAPISKTNWSFVITADKEEVLVAIPKLVKAILTVMIIVFLLGIVLVSALDYKLTKPLIEMIRHSKRIAELDVREDIAEIYLKQKDEIGTLSKAFQALTMKLREIIYQITESSNLVSDTSGTLSGASIQSAQISQELSKTMEEISIGAMKQAESTEAGAAQAITLSKIIEKNNEHMRHMNNSNREVNGLVNSGLQVINHLTEVTKENDTATKEICTIILQTKKSSELIKEASHMISDMAKQTNLLALNATIEAARAGEAGRGFGVVAEEIQKMADQSAASTKHIDEIIRKLLSDVSKAVNSMERISETSVEQQQSVSDTIIKYNAIASSIKTTDEVAVELNASLESINQVKNEMMGILQSLSAIAQQNSAGTQEAATAMEEQTQSARDLAEVSNRMASLAYNLQTITASFSA